MAVTQESIFEAVPEALGRHAKQVVAKGCYWWSFAMANGSLIRGHAHWDGRWLLAAAGPVCPDGPRHLDAAELPRLLEHHRGVPGGVRFGLAPSGAVRLHAEAVLDSADDAAEAVDALCRGLQLAAGRLHGHEPPAAEVEADAPANAPELLSVVEAAGYAGRARGDGSVAVPLEAHQGAACAIFRGGDHGCTAELAVSAAGLGEPRCAGAASAFLLTLSHVVRLVRPVPAPGPAVSLEVVWGRVPGPAAFAAGLAALTVAHRNCAHELALLGDPVVAMHYLGHRAPAWMAGSGQDETTTGELE